LTPSQPLPMALVQHRFGAAWPAPRTTTALWRPRHAMRTIAHVFRVNTVDACSLRTHTMTHLPRLMLARVRQSCLGVWPRRLPTMSPAQMSTMAAVIMVAARYRRHQTMTDLPLFTTAAATQQPTDAPTLSQTTFCQQQMSRMGAAWSWAAPTPLHSTTRPRRRWTVGCALTFHHRRPSYRPRQLPHRHHRLHLLPHHHHRTLRLRRTCLRSHRYHLGFQRQRCHPCLGWIQEASTV